MQIQYKKYKHKNRFICTHCSMKSSRYFKGQQCLLFLLKTVATSDTKLSQLISVCSHEPKFVSKNVFHIEPVIKDTLSRMKPPLRLYTSFVI